MRKNHLTVIFMKDTNRPVTYIISIKLLIIFVIMFVGGISTYAFFIKGYFSLFNDNQQLEEIIRSLRTEIGSLQSSINTLKNQQADLGKSEDATAEKPVVTGIQPLVQENDIVEIQDLFLAREMNSDNLGFSFILYNVTEDERMLRGYLFVVLRDDRGQKISSFPEAKVSEGLPADYRQGDRYAIRRFKGYRGELRLAGNPGIFEIIVYSDTGELIAHVRKPVPAES